MGIRQYEGVIGLAPGPAPGENGVTFSEDHFTWMRVLDLRRTERDEDLFSGCFAEGDVLGKLIHGMPTYWKQVLQGNDVADIHQGVDAGQGIISQNPPGHSLH